MGLIAEDKGGSFERCPSGAHLARCYRIVDLGKQKSEYLGKIKYLNKVMLVWEIHGVNEDGTPIRMKDGRPFAISKNYTLSWSDKANLRLDLQSWRGKPFMQEELRRCDLRTFLGAWCMLNVIEREGQDGTQYSNVKGVTPVPAMIKQNGLPAPVNKNELFDIDDPDIEMFNGFYDALKKKIEASPEWQKRTGSSESVSQVAEEFPDIPF